MNLLDRLILAVVRRRLRVRGMLHPFLSAVNDAVESTGHQQLAAVQMESVSLQARLVSQAAVREFEKAGGTSAVQ